MNTITYLTINVDTFKILKHANYRSQATSKDPIVGTSISWSAKELTINMTPKLSDVSGIVHTKVDPSKFLTYAKLFELIDQANNTNIVSTKKMFDTFDETAFKIIDKHILNLEESFLLTEESRGNLKYTLKRAYDKKNMERLEAMQNDMNISINKAIINNK